MNGAALDRVLGKLAGVQKSGAEFSAWCPAHEADGNGHRRSLSVKADGGKVLLHCHAGCTKEAVVAAAGLTMGDLFDESKPRATSPPTKLGPIVATYDYCNAAGALVNQVCRYAEPTKDFRQRRPDGKGGWIWNLAGVERVLYRLPDLIDRTDTYLAEGEEDVAALRALGLVATTTCGGAKAWRKGRYAEQLHKAGCLRLTVFPDNDDPGRRYAEDVARSCAALGIVVKVVELPGLPVSEDVRWWLRAGHTREDLLALVAEASTWAPANAGATAAVSEPDLNLTEAAAARRFALEVGNQLRYDHRRGRWLVWDQHRWTPDTNGRALRIALECARRWQREAVDLADPRRKSAVFEWALKFEARAKVENMLALARNLIPLTDPGDSWDLNPWLLGVRNGVVDLRTGRLRDGRQADKITLQAGAKFDPAAECPRWRRFLREVLSENEALVDYLHRVVGYLLTGLTVEQAFWILVGLGSNGKTTLVRALLAILGDYGYSCPFETFALHPRGSVPNDIAALAGRRLVEASEATEGTRINEALIKRLTGGDTITARFLNHEFFSFTPNLKLLLCTNHKPVVRDSSVGFWRRCRLIPFTRTFAPDPTLAAKLEAEGPGILAWAVEGCLSWQASELRAPADVEAATGDYERDSDPLGDFVAGGIERDPAAEMGAADLYALYRTWAERQGLSERERLTATAFGRRMAETFERHKTAHGWVYSGVARR